MRKTIVALAVCVLVAADKPADAVKKDLEKLDGEKVMVSGERDGQVLPEEIIKDAKRVLKDGVTTVTVGGQVFLKARITIDPAKKPKTIDYLFLEGNNKDEKALGIYEIDGEMVKFCFARPGEDRPADFTAKEGSGRTLTVWKREKK